MSNRGLSLGQVQKVARRFRNRVSAKAAILMYHRVADICPDPWSLGVSPRHLAEHLDILRKHARLLRLQQLVQACREEQLALGSVAITFDDGYADNLYTAKPILERYDAPATIFLATGYLGRQRQFWWDELATVLLRPGTLPGVLSLRIEDAIHEWRLGKAAHYSEAQSFRDRHRRAWEGKRNSRHFLHYSLWRVLQPLRDEERLMVLDQLRQWAGVEVEVSSCQRPLRLEEVAQLDESNLIELGAHTVTHPCLPMHSTALQRAEICSSKARLEEIIGRPVRSFSYPHGEYTQMTVQLVREAGFECACSDAAEPVWRDCDLFRLPRYQVPDCDGEEFAQWLVKAGILQA